MLLANVKKRMRLHTAACHLQDTVAGTRFQPHMRPLSLFRAQHLRQLLAQAGHGLQNGAIRAPSCHPLLIRLSPTLSFVKTFPTTARRGGVCAPGGIVELNSQIGNVAHAIKLGILPGHPLALVLKG